MKENYAKVIGFCKKWLKVEFIVVTNFFLKVLNETSHLFYLFKSDSVLIYQLRDAVKDTIENLIDMKNDDVGDMLFKQRQQTSHLVSFKKNTQYESGRPYRC